MKLSPRSFLFVAFTTASASALSLIGGLGLESVANKILPLVPLIIALPGLNDLVGDYASIIAAHHGDPSENSRSRKELAKAIFKVVWINIIFIILLGLGLAAARGYISQPMFITKFSIFIATSVFLSIFLMFLLARVLEAILKNKHTNPDELLIPIITSLADIVMLLFVTLAVFTIF